MDHLRQIPGGVYEAHDTKTETKSAIIITIDKDEAHHELRILQTLSLNDPQILSRYIAEVIWRNTKLCMADIALIASVNGEDKQ